jgi:hypothetical protein
LTDVARDADAADADRQHSGKHTSFSNSQTADAPWTMGWQMNERNVVWSNDLKLRLVKVPPIACRRLLCPPTYC